MFTFYFIQYITCAQTALSIVPIQCIHHNSLHLVKSICKDKKYTNNETDKKNMLYMFRRRITLTCFMKMKTASLLQHPLSCDNLYFAALGTSLHSIFLLGPPALLGCAVLVLCCKLCSSFLCSDLLSAFVSWLWFFLL
jgi:hypothetical protein